MPLRRSRSPLSFYFSFAADKYQMTFLRRRCNSLIAIVAILSPPYSIEAFHQSRCSPSASTRCRHRKLKTTGCKHLSLSAHDMAQIDFQSDETQFGRGEHHLTFCLQENDVVVYQEGTWYVDGVAVGPGDDPTWSYAVVDTIQIVWSHNCEHGVVRGYQLELDTDEMTLIRTDDEIDFGPEQIVARINNVEWNDDDDESIGISHVPLSDAIWRDASITAEE